MNHAHEADHAADCRDARKHLFGLDTGSRRHTKVTWIGRDGKEVDADTCPAARLKNTIAMYARKGMAAEADELRKVAWRRGIAL